MSSEVFADSPKEETTKFLNETVAIEEGEETLLCIVPKEDNLSWNNTFESSFGSGDASDNYSPLKTLEDLLDAEDTFDPRNVSTTEPPKPWSEWKLKDFEIGRPLGEGIYGHVYLSRTKKEKFIVALKIIHAVQVDGYEVGVCISRETDIHADLDHENIIKMYGYFRDEDKIVFVIEYAPGGDIYSLQRKQSNRRFSDERAATYIYQVVLALEYLHEKGITHRDIKPENLLVGYYGELKMTDFGWSIKVNPNDNKNKRKTICGTTDYLPPEMVEENSGPYSEKVDNWCVGVLLFEFLVGSVPFLSETNDDTMAKILAGQYEIPKYVTDEAKDLIQKILVKADDRLNLAEIRTHPWVEKNRSKTKKLLPIFEPYEHLIPELEKLYNETQERIASGIRTSQVVDENNNN